MLWLRREMAKNCRKHADVTSAAVPNPVGGFCNELETKNLLGMLLADGVNHLQVSVELRNQISFSLKDVPRKL